MKCPLNLWGILSSSLRAVQFVPVSASPRWSNPLSCMRWVMSKFFSPFLWVGREFMLRNPIKSCVGVCLLLYSGSPNDLCSVGESSLYLFW